MEPGMCLCLDLSLLKRNLLSCCCVDIPVYRRTALRRIGVWCVVCGVGCGVWVGCSVYLGVVSWCVLCMRVFVVSVIVSLLLC